MNNLSGIIGCVICCNRATRRSAGLIDSHGARIISEENMMTKTSVVAALLLSLAIGLGPAWAQQDQPAAPPAPKAQMSPEKKAISKKCSDLANAKNLHGKERKKFRAECKRKGGNMPE
jgi:hypothetical protein